MGIKDINKSQNCDKKICSGNSSILIIPVITLLFLLIFIPSHALAATITKCTGDSATITVTCSDPDANLAQCKVTSPCTNTCAAAGSSGTCSCTYTCTAIGTYSACGEAIDGDGLSSGAICYDQIVCADCNAPTTTITAPPAGSWQNTDYIVNIADSDTGGSGLANCYYRVLSNGIQTRPWTIRPCSTPVTLTVGPGNDCQDEGPNRCKIEAYAKDNANNAGSTVSRNFSIDWTPPTTIITAPPAGSWQNTDYIVNIADSDTGGSGLANCYYRVLSNGIQTRPWTIRPCSTPVTLTVGPGNDCQDEGPNMCKIEAYADDNANNIEPTVSRDFGIDWTPPSITATDSPDPVESGKEVTFTAICNDGPIGSGCNTTKICDDSICSYVYCSVDHNIVGDTGTCNYLTDNCDSSTNDYWAYATDILGNVNPTYGGIFTVKKAEGCDCDDSSECLKGSCALWICMLLEDPEIHFADYASDSAVFSLGSRSVLVLKVRNNLPAKDTIRLQLLGSPDQRIVYWSKFSNNDKSIDIEIAPDEEVAIPISIFAGQVGIYELKVFAESLSYNSLTAHGSRIIYITSDDDSGLFSISPGLSWFYLMMTVLAGLAIYHHKTQKTTMKSSPLQAKTQSRKCSGSPTQNT